MSKDDFEHQMDFILKQQAVFSSEMIELKESIGELKEVTGEMSDIQKKQGENIDKLTALLGSVVVEMRDSFDKLIVANEITRDLANKVAALEVQTSQRVTGLEHRVNDLEQKQ